MVFFTLLGLFLLLVGALFYVRALIPLAEEMRLSKFVLGMTVTALLAVVPFAQEVNGISLPIEGTTSNIGLLLGLFLLFCPFRFPKQARWFSLPLLLLVYVILFLVFWGGKVSQMEGAFLFLCFGLYLFSQIFFIPRRKGLVLISWKKIFFLSLAAGFFASSRFFLSGWVYSISLPLAAMGIACLVWKQGELFFGAVLGSAVLNLLFAIPLFAVQGPILFSQSILLNRFPLMVVFTLLLWVLMFFGKRRLSRIDGGILLASFLAYRCYLFFS